MSFVVQTIGTGPDIVFFHGWGMNSEVWQETARVLSENYRVHLIDLPGFGQNNHESCDYEIDSLTQMILPHLPEQAIIVGWSMGGLLAMNIAVKFPQRISKLILIASNAQFVASDDWPTAMRPEILDGFVKNLSEDYQQTLQRFLMLQARGGDNSRETIRALKHRLYQHGEPAAPALSGGLALLKNTKLVNQLSDIKVPVLLLYGKLDALVPVAAAEKMAQAIPDAKLHIFQKAAHAPFISHYNEFINEVDRFLNDTK